MSKRPMILTDRRQEAERLIELARGLLNRPEEEIVVTYLDQAIETLHIVAEREISGSD